MKKLFLYSTITCLVFTACSNPEKKTDPNVQAANNATEGRHYFIDVHELGKVTFADVEAAHKKDLATQGKYGVSFEKFWVDEKAGKVYCLSQAKDSASVAQTHKEAHGLMPVAVYEVTSGGNDAAMTGKSIFIDVHQAGPGQLTPEAVAEIHKKDLANEGKHNVNFVNYYLDQKQGTVFCISEAADSNDIQATHKESGAPANYVVAVQEGK